MAFSPRNVVGCLLKKRLTKVGGSRAPQDPPPYLRPWQDQDFSVRYGGLSRTNFERFARLLKMVLEEDDDPKGFSSDRKSYLVS